MSQTTWQETLIKGGAMAVAAAAGAAKAQELDGAYGGLSLDRGSGDIAYDDGVYSFDGNGGGAFVGYNSVIGNWLLGGELAFSNGGYAVPETGLSPYIEAGRVIDLKARVGRVFGRTLVYGVVGGSTVQLSMSTPVATDGNATGVALGVGIETAIGAKGFAGIEYLSRDLNFDFATAPAADEGATIHTIALRLGMRF